MKSTITFLLVLIGASSIWAQNPAIIWQNTIGGDKSDQVRDMDSTLDGGTIIVGESLSDISGDKTENSNGGMDIWVVKLDANGAMEWQKTIGGSGEDLAGTIQQTSDGGYIIGASSKSSISGNKTENSRGKFDYWIIKLDNVGGIMWQHTYGGNQNDNNLRVIGTSDGGYIASGSSDSSISGDRTEPAKGSLDIWVIKMDSTGAILWQKSLGGNGYNNARSLIETADGGYLTAGTSTSNISGDKTEPNIGGADWWIVKLDATGTIMWDKTIGGTDTDLLLSTIQTADGGYVLGGHSRSGISGDKTDPNLGLDDLWIVKIDSLGTIEWQNTIGGDFLDYFGDIKEEASGNFILSAYSRSGVSGNKTVSRSGGYHLWILRLDVNGVILSQSIIGGVEDDIAPYLNLTSQNEMVISCSSKSSISGDKTAATRGDYDYWILKVNTNLLLDVPSYELSMPISVYPNPTNGNFSIDLGKEYSNVTVQITDMLGKLISTSKYASAKIIEQEINGSNGIYFVNIDIAEGTSKSFKIIKN